MDCIKLIADYIIDHPELEKFFMPIMKESYDLDFLEEDVLIQFHMEAVNDDDLKGIRKRMMPFIEWLQNADEDSDD